MLESFQQAARFCGPHPRPQSASGRRRTNSAKPGARPHSALPLPTPPATRLAPLLCSQWSAKQSSQNGHKQHLIRDFLGAFDEIDVDRSGQIDASEFHKLFGGKYTQEELVPLLAAIDKDGDESVDRMEFLRFFIDSAHAHKKDCKAAAASAVPTDDSDALQAASSPAAEASRLRARTVSSESSRGEHTADGMGTRDGILSLAESFMEKALSAHPSQQPSDTDGLELSRDELASRRKMRLEKTMARLMQPYESYQSQVQTAADTCSNPADDRQQSMLGLLVCWKFSQNARRRYLRKRSTLSSHVIDTSPTQESKDIQHMLLTARQFVLSMDRGAESQDANESFQYTSESPISSRRNYSDADAKLGRSSEVGIDADNRKEAANRRNDLRQIVRRSLLHDEHKCCLERELENKQIMRKLRHFDSRRFPKVRNPLSLGSDVARGSDYSDQVEIGFTIVGCSSQRPACEAANLLLPHGTWQSQSHGKLVSRSVSNEYVIFEINGHPTTVSGIQLTMNGSNTNPRRCKVQYSPTAQGPWGDAFALTVESKSARHCRVRHEYGKATQVFRELVLGIWSDIDMARNFLDTNSNGMLSRSDFDAACMRLRQLCQNPLLADTQKVFRDLDVQNTGEIDIEWIFSEVVRRPIAPFWRLLIVDNYGAQNSAVLFSPLRLFSTEDKSQQQLVHRDQRQQTQLVEQIVLGKNTAEDQSSTGERTIRRVAQEYSVDVDEVERLYNEFTLLDVDSTGTLERPEFEQLLCKVHGVVNIKDLPKSRMDFYWTQLDEDCNGAIDFEEFVVWYIRKLRNLPKEMLLRPEASDQVPWMAVTRRETRFPQKGVMSPLLR